MKEKIFVTETDPKQLRRWILQRTLIIFLIMSGLCCFGFLISWQAFVFFEVIAMISCFITSLKKTPYYSFRFEGDKLYINSKTSGENFVVYDVTADDFVIKQTKGEIEGDYCSLWIKRTQLMFGGIKKCSEMRKYISENFK